MLSPCGFLLQDGALKLMESLSNENQEMLKLDLSFCGLTSDFVGRILEKVYLINGIIELNLGGNPITQEVHFNKYN